MADHRSFHLWWLNGRWLRQLGVQSKGVAWIPWLCLATLGVGILSVVLNGVAPELHSRKDDAFEWVLAVLINAHALWLALLWRKNRFRARLWAG